MPWKEYPTAGSRPHHLVTFHNVRLQAPCLTLPTLRRINHTTFARPGARKLPHLASIHPFRLEGPWTRVLQEEFQRSPPAPRPSAEIGLQQGRPHRLQHHPIPLKPCCAPHLSISPAARAPPPQPAPSPSPDFPKRTPSSHPHPARCLPHLHTPPLLPTPSSSLSHSKSQSCPGTCLCICRTGLPPPTPHPRPGPAPLSAASNTSRTDLQSWVSLRCSAKGFSPLFFSR